MPTACRRRFAKARRAQAAVDSTDDFDLKLMAREFKCSTERFCRLLRLNYLAPDIAAAIFAGAQPPGLTMSRLAHGALPLDWDLQRRIFEFPARADAPQHRPQWHFFVFLHEP